MIPAESLAAVDGSARAVSLDAVQRSHRGHRGYL